jgi:hypothetical protein
VGLERGPLSLVRVTEELLEWKTEINGRGDPLRWPRDTLYPLKMALTSTTSVGGSVGIVRLRSFLSSFSNWEQIRNKINERHSSIAGIHGLLFVQVPEQNRFIQQNKGSTSSMTDGTN